MIRATMPPDRATGIDANKINAGGKSGAKVIIK
jgi:hypothetical protein